MVYFCLIAGFQVKVSVAPLLYFRFDPFFFPKIDRSVSLALGFSF